LTENIFDAIFATYSRMVMFEQILAKIHSVILTAFVFAVILADTFNFVAAVSKSGANAVSLIIGLARLLALVALVHLFIRFAFKKFT
jgi:hypothetical protein